MPTNQAEEGRRHGVTSLQARPETMLSKQAGGKANSKATHFDCCMIHEILNKTDVRYWKGSLIFYQFPLTVSPAMLDFFELAALDFHANSSPGHHQLMPSAPPALHPAPVGTHKQMQGRCGATAPGLTAALAATLGGWWCSWLHMQVWGRGAEQKQASS